jgi:hypothetical protein
MGLMPSKHLLDGAHHIDGSVLRGDHSALFDIRTDHKGDAAVGIHMVQAVLHIILDHKDQGIVGIRTLGHLLDEQAGSIVVVGHLRLGRIDPGDGALVPFNSKRMGWRRFLPRISPAL